MKKDTIAWECPSCGHQHLWRWPEGESSPGGITMFCSKCGKDHVTEMVRIGRHVWSAIYEEPK